MLELYSPAKINLFFRILGKRPDGYHEIVSLYQAIDLFDRLFFEFSKDDLITCSDPEIPTDQSNLVAKSLSLFRERFPFQNNIKSHIEKNIPTQAGLGGGSSNAATTLWGLNQILGSPASLSDLIQMGSAIGSDVSFFFSSGSAHCTSRGEVFKSTSLPAPISGYIAKPQFGLSTPLVYQHVDVKKLIQHHSCPYFNDLEVSSFTLEPRLMDLKQQLKKSFKTVVMTGSGTAFFCIDGKIEGINGVTFIPFSSTHRSTWYNDKG